MAYGLWPCGLMTLHKIEINSFKLPIQLPLTLCYVASYIAVAGLHLTLLIMAGIKMGHGLDCRL